MNAMVRAYRIRKFLRGIWFEILEPYTLGFITGSLLTTLYFIFLMIGGAFK